MSRPPTNVAPILHMDDSYDLDDEENLQSRYDVPTVIEHTVVRYDDNDSSINAPRFAKFSKIVISRRSERLEPPRISNWANVGSFPSPLIDNPAQLNLGQSFVGEKETILVDIISDRDNSTMSREFVRAGPHRELAFHPQNQVRACIVTCGGLCPGLNSVIRELVITLKMMYRVQHIYGIPFGYRGFYSTHMRTIQLNELVVADIHHEGGSIIGSSRGGHDTQRICDAIVAMGYNQIYIIGGDGTQRGTLAIHEELRKRKIMASVVGIPKTIDNDIALIDKSFGFDTAVEEAQRSIKCAKIEAKSAINGIGLVKLMGRHSGQIAMFATLASRDVDCCLIPEISFELDGKNGLFQYIEDKLRQKGHMVIVIAEGAGLDMIEKEQGTTGNRDASGNLKMSDVGQWLKKKINDDFSRRHREINLKLIDPTYEIRSVPANASDNLHCSLLAQSAVHGAMHGYTGFCVGMINTHLVMIPIEEICRRGRTKVDVKSRMWHRVIATTLQPSLSHPEEPSRKESKTTNTNNNSITFSTTTVINNTIEDTEDTDDQIDSTSSSFGRQLIMNGDQLSESQEDDNQYNNQRFPNGGGNSRGRQVISENESGDDSPNITINEDDIDDGQEGSLMAVQTGVYLRPNLNPNF